MSPEKNKNDDEYRLKMGISLWLSICLFLCVWFLSRFIRGRRQLRRNLHVIEDGLRRMQTEIDRRQRENSITYGQGNETFGESLQKHLNDKMKQKEQEEQQQNQDDNQYSDGSGHGGDGDKNELKQVDDNTTITTTIIVDKKND